MKIALCFIINYEHILNKEEIWKKWIEPNEDIINVYFYYKDYRKIKSKWILEHTIPPNNIHETSYFHVIPAYISVMNFAFNHDNENNWFCLLTDSCCPVISPKRFRYMFYNHYGNSIFKWSKPWWNPEFNKRSNLLMLPKDLWVANDPWFILTRINVHQIINFMKTQQKIVKTICDGGLANETLFSVILKCYNEISFDSNSSRIINAPTHITDWNRRSSTTSPHVFSEGNQQDIKFINEELERNKYAFFIRKVSTEFPDDILNHYIYKRTNLEDDMLVLNVPFAMTINKVKIIMKKIIFGFILLFGFYSLLEYIN